MNKNIIFSFILLSLTLKIYTAEVSQKTDGDKRLEILTQLNTGHNPENILKKYKLEGIHEVFSHIGPQPIQNIVLDYLHEGRKELILQDSRAAVIEKYEEDKKLLADFLKKSCDGVDQERVIKCRCSDYFYSLYPQRLDLVKRLPIVASILWDRQKNEFRELQDSMFFVGKINRLSFVNNQKLLKYNPYKPADQQVSYEDDVNTLSVSYGTIDRGAVIRTRWDLSTGQLIDYALSEYTENSFSFDEDFSVTKSEKNKTVTAVTIDRTKVKLMIQDDLKDLDSAILAKLLSLPHKMESHPHSIQQAPRPTWRNFLYNNRLAIIGSTAVGLISGIATWQLKKR